MTVVMVFGGYARSSELFLKLSFTTVARGSRSPALRFLERIGTLAAAAYSPDRSQVPELYCAKLRMQTAGMPATPNRTAERWLRGRKQRFAKPSWGLKLYRGFESPPLRHYYITFLFTISYTS